LKTAAIFLGLLYIFVLAGFIAAAEQEDEISLPVSL
jgi:hypothetical protein